MENNTTKQHDETPVAKFKLSSGAVVDAKFGLGGWWYYDYATSEYEMIPLDAEFAAA
jgi:hypothetical protein